MIELVARLWQAIACCADKRICKRGIALRGNDVSDLLVGRLAK
jgi:hypothetical protein